MESVPARSDRSALLSQLQANVQMKHASPTAVQRWMQEELGVRLDQVFAQTTVAQAVLAAQQQIGQSAIMHYRALYQTVQDQLDVTVNRELPVGPRSTPAKPGPESSPPARVDFSPMLATHLSETLGMVGAVNLTAQQVAYYILCEIASGGFLPPDSVRYSQPRRGLRRLWSG